MKLHLSDSQAPKPVSAYRFKPAKLTASAIYPHRLKFLVSILRRAITLSLIVLSLLYSSAIRAQDNAKLAPPQILTIGFHSVPPFVYRDSQGRPAGELMEFQIKLIEDAGYRWVAKNFPGKRLHHALRAGEVNIYLGPALRTEYREKVLVSEFVIAFLEMRLYHLNESIPIYSLEELSNQHLVIVRGYTYGGWASHFKKPHSLLKITEVGNHLQGMKMLKSHRAPYFLGYDRAGHQALTEMSVKSIQYNTVMNTPMYTIISKRTPNAHEVMANLTTAFNATERHERPGRRPLQQ